MLILVVSAVSLRRDQGSEGLENLMRKIWRRICSALSGLALLATTAAAQDMPSAVGRIIYSDVLQPGAAICSGVLVAPDLVLTAAHCVRAAAEDPATLRFDAGWTDGHPTARRLGRAVILAADTLPPGLAGLAQDMALVRLDTAFGPDEATPLPIAAPSAGVFVLHAFARAAPAHPAPAIPCDLLATRPGLLGLDCPVVSGNSGAPLLQGDGEGLHITAVMVAAARIGPVRSWAVLPPGALLTQISPKAE